MPRTQKGGSWLRLRNWRVRSRLIALIIIPTIVGVILGAVQLTNAVGTSAEYSRLTEVAALVERIDVLIHEMDKERDLTAWYIAEGRRQARFKKVREQQDAVDQAREPVLSLVSDMDASHTARVRAEADEIRRWLEGLPGLRERIAEPSVPPRAALRMYSAVISVLQRMQGELGTSGFDQRLLGDSIALNALSQAKEEAARQRGLMTVALTSRAAGGAGFDYDDFVDFPGSWSRQESQTARFIAEASPADAKFYDDTVSGQQVDKADSMRALALSQLRQYKEIQDLDPLRRDDTSVWYAASSAVVDRMRQVEERLVGSVVQQSQALRDEAQRQALISGGLILVLLLLVLIITAVVASSLTRPLRRLRAEALEIAGVRLPETVQRLRETSDSNPSAEVVPIGVNSRDEMGEVARAFDEVHREAIRLAGDEARLRSNVNAMFVNLSRRSQTLVERQLSLIDGLEQGEQDENRLANLFKLDHLATRMRRNSENLLVLAGQEPARRWSQPVPLVDIVRASLSEVESYERVDVRVQSGTSVIGQAVNDVVHLVAELVENAISFSPRETKVVVSSNRIDGGGVMISVSDSGIGMTADELAEANWRLANPPVVDVSVSRRMGLFVVGRLALRHSIRVQLRQQDVGGLNAMVLLPDALLSASGAPQFAGMPAEAMGPATGGQYGAPQQAPSFGGAPFGGSGGFEPAGTRGGGRPPVFGADDPAAATPPGGQGAFQRDPFERDPFERFERDPFERPAAGRPPFERPGGPRNMFESPAPTQTPGGNPFERGDEDPFDKYFNPNPPLDTPWPADVPPPGGGPGHTGPGNAWPGLADQDTASWPAVPGGAQAPSSPGGPPTGGSMFGPPTGGSSYGGPPTGGSSYGGPPTGGSPGGPSTGPMVTGPLDRPSRFGATPDLDHTGPLPAVHSSALDGGEEEYLPIFAAVESDWFRRSEPSAQPQSEAEVVVREEQPVPPAADRLGEERVGAESRAWSSPGDAGWQAARAASDPSLGGITSSGLPKRVPKANLVPGSADPTPSVFSPPPSLSPDRVRSRLSSFQQGVRKGRAVARGEHLDEDSSSSMRNSERNKEDS
ncbi:nitrate- and nitrite sensing domain-containing protein [Sphaerisporangium sp. B11E5]|uniref:sensor histidine kinase n=1 Tax=Sphaerisporangium sp. B11E5 TaxID=3153563 RepID=UPI00325F498B